MDSHLQRLQRAIDEATRGMTTEDLTRHVEGKWCAAEVLEHLYLTYAGSVKGLERCLQAGKPLARAATLKDHLRTAAVVRLGYFPTGRRAPENTNPRGMTTDAVVEGVGAKIAAMEKLLVECEARYGTRARLLDHPVLGPLTGEQWRKFHWIHGRHHMKHIARIRASAGRSS